MKSIFRVDRGVTASIMADCRSSFPSTGVLPGNAAYCSDSAVVVAASRWIPNVEQEYRYLPSTTPSGFPVIGMLAHPGYLPFRDILHLADPSPRSSLVLGAMRPALGFLAVDLPCTNQMLFLMSQPFLFRHTMEFWPMMYIFAKVVLSMFGQPNPRRFHMPSFNFYTDFQWILAFLESATPLPVSPRD